MATVLPVPPKTRETDIEKCPFPATARLFRCRNAPDRGVLLELLVSRRRPPRRRLHPAAWRCGETPANASAPDRGEGWSVHCARVFPCAARADPLASLGRRAPSVPLTDAWLEFAIAGQVLRPNSRALLVNGDAADWVERVADDEVAPREIPVEPSDAPLVKDLTWQVLVSSVTGAKDELEDGLI
jgi:hypothetical protein